MQFPLRAVFFSRASPLPADGVPSRDWRAAVRRFAGAQLSLGPHPAGAYIEARTVGGNALCTPENTCYRCIRHLYALCRIWRMRCVSDACACDFAFADLPLLSRAARSYSDLVFWLTFERIAFDEMLLMRTSARSLYL